MHLCFPQIRILLWKQALPPCGHRKSNDTFFCKFRLKRACYYAYLVRKMQNFLRQWDAAPLQTLSRGPAPGPLWTPRDSWLAYINMAWLNLAFLARYKIVLGEGALPSCNPQKYILIYIMKCFSQGSTACFCVGGGGWGVCVCLFVCLFVWLFVCLFVCFCFLFLFFVFVQNVVFRVIPHFGKVRDFSIGPT